MKTCRFTKPSPFKKPEWKEGMDYPKLVALACGITNPLALADAFTWSATPEGILYWSELMEKDAVPVEAQAKLMNMVITMSLSTGQKYTTDLLDVL